MGALAATLPPWNTEDDLLLKNAVESGASLESLAKGAVQFSRKYSITEIHDRWYSLLYDPVISKEAATRISNFELSASPLPSKFSKFGHSNHDRKVASLKRKAGTVRTSYYAMRKRTCNDMLTSTDFNFLVDPENVNYFANGSDSLPEPCIPEGATSNHFSNLDPPQYGFQENMMDVDVPSSEVTAYAFCPAVDDTVEDNFPIESENVPKDGRPQTLEDVSLDGTAAQELGVPNELDIDNLIRDEDISLSAFDQINNDPVNLCSEFDENHMFDSPELECGTSFDTLELSPLPDMPIWRTDEGIQEPDIPCDGLEDSIACGDTYLAELSDSLLNFNDDEELLLMDADGKDGIEKSYYDGLSSLLLDPPIEVGPDPPEKVEAELLGPPHACITNLSVPCLTEVDDNAGLQSNGVQVVHKIEFQMPSSATAKDPQFSEQINGVIFCALNTCDPKVPSNDDVFLPFDVPPPAFYCPSKSNSKRCYRKTSRSVPDNECRAGERGKVLMQVEQIDSIDSHPSSHMLGSRGLSRPICGSKNKREMPNSHAMHTVSKSAINASGGLRLGGNSSAAKTTHALVNGNSNIECINVGVVKHLSNNVTNSSNEKPDVGSNDFRNHLQPNVSSRKHESDVALPLGGHRLQHAEMGSSNILESEVLVNPPKLDEEEQHIESDDDVPYYSDVEGMVLDMDLDPDDQDMYYNEEVSRYEDEETKRAIIRLEQGAHSHMQRAMASHGAFAMLYGRHAKHYINKPEVLLGRATEGVNVDVDLSKGGCVNTISRRQAIIKMDKDGSFNIKNVGKSSMLVNNKELHTGQSQRLHSNYLIELRGMTFIFETNQSRVKWYLDHINDNF